METALYDILEILEGTIKQLDALDGETHSRMSGDLSTAKTILIESFLIIDEDGDGLCAWNRLRKCLWY